MKFTSIIRCMIVDRRLLDRAVKAEAGVAHHDVEPAERASARATSRARVGSRVTSIATASARPPADANRRDGLIEPVRTARAQHDGDALPARCSATARPIPADAPVIAATVPLRSYTP